MGGKVHSDFGAHEFINDLILQPDGKLLAAGATGNANFATDFLLVRYNPNGDLDTTFGNGGRVITDLGLDSERISAVALAADGKIGVGGSRGTATSGDTEWVVARYNADGTLDDGGPSDSTPGDSFGAGGMVIHDFRDTDTIWDLFIQPDGEIVAVGNTQVYPSIEVDVVVVRYNPDGTLDGLVTTNIQVADEGRSAAMLPDGKLIVAGTTYASGGAGGRENLLLLRYTLQLSLDPTFDNDGIVITDLGGNDYINSIALQSDGKIVAAATTSNWDQFAIAHYNADGSLDSTFQAGLKGNQIAYGVQNVLLQDDGKIVMAGTSPVTAQGRSFMLWRFLADGSVDPSFGVGGHVTTDFCGDDDTQAGAAIDANQRVVLTGGARCAGSADLALARYTLNDAPTIMDIVDQATDEDIATPPIPFTVGDLETPAGSLTVSGSSSNPTLVPNGSIVFGGSGASRTVTVTPAANQFGAATITITASDGAASASDTFELTVNAINDFPASTAMSTNTEEGTAKVITMAGSDVDSVALTFRVVSGPSHGTLGAISNTSRIPVPNGVGATGASCTASVIYEPDDCFMGPDAFTYRVNDGAQESNLATVSVVVARPLAAVRFSGGVLTVIGTPKADTIRLLRSRRGFSVSTNFAAPFVIPDRRSLAQVRVCADDANDTVNLALLATNQSATVYVGLGNDSITTGRGNDIVLGGPGEDMLIGGRGHNLLIGGQDVDRLIGSSGSDLLISDDLRNPIHQTELRAVLDVLQATTNAEAKRAAAQPLVDRLLADDAKDTVTGSKLIDLFAVGASDVITDARPEDIVIRSL